MVGVTNLLVPYTIATCVALPTFDPTPVKPVVAIAVLMAVSVDVASALVFEEDDVMPKN